jgi:hypothetical protein
LNNELKAATAKAYGNALNKYIRNIGTMNKATAYEYQFRLTAFAATTSVFECFLSEMVIMLYILV